MRKVVFWGLSLLLIGTLVKPAWAQEQPKFKNTEDYNAFMAAYNENDPAKKAANAEKFLDTFKDADPLARQQMYMMLLRSYYAAKNFQKALDTADKQATNAPNISAADKLVVLQVGMLSAEQLKNNAKHVDYIEKVLGADPKNATALITMSTLLANSIPTEDGKKDAHFTKTLEITRRGLALAQPEGVQPAQWNQVKAQLHDTTCMVLLNQKKYADAIAACDEALKLEKKDGYAYYLKGLAMKPTVAEAIAKYSAAIDKLNLPENRTADQLVRDGLKADAEGFESAATAKTNELVEIFAKSVATGWQGASNPARNELKIFKGTPDELDKLIAAKKAEL